MRSASGATRRAVPRTRTPGVLRLGPARHRGAAVGSAGRLRGASVSPKRSRFGEYGGRPSPPPPRTPPALARSDLRAGTRAPGAVRRRGNVEAPARAPRARRTARRGGSTRPGRWVGRLGAGGRRPRRGGGRARTGRRAGGAAPRGLSARRTPHAHASGPRRGSGPGRPRTPAPGVFGPISGPPARARGGAAAPYFCSSPRRAPGRAPRAPRSAPGRGFGAVARGEQALLVPRDGLRAADRAETSRAIWKKITLSTVYGVPGR